MHLEAIGEGSLRYALTEAQHGELQALAARVRLAVSAALLRIHDRLLNALNTPLLRAVADVDLLAPHADMDASAAAIDLLLPGLLRAVRNAGQHRTRLRALRIYRGDLQAEDTTSELRALLASSAAVRHALAAATADVTEAQVDELPALSGLLGWGDAAARIGTAGQLSAAYAPDAHLTAATRIADVRHALQLMHDDVNHGTTASLAVLLDGDGEHNCTRGTGTGIRTSLPRKLLRGSVAARLLFDTIVAAVSRRPLPDNSPWRLVNDPALVARACTQHAQAAVLGLTGGSDIDTDSDTLVLTLAHRTDPRGYLVIGGDGAIVGEQRLTPDAFGAHEEAGHALALVDNALCGSG
jgi:hypothetical protein